MWNLIRANLIRLFRNMVFIGGLGIAFGCTMIFEIMKPMEFMVSMSENRIMIFVSAAIVLFFSFFTPLFVGTEYADGVIRNKMIAGHSQLTIYLADYITMIFAMLMMMGFWFFGGLAGGAKITGNLLSYIAVAVCYNMAYLAIMMAISFRMKHKIWSTIVCMGVFYVSTNLALIGNMFLAFSEGQMLRIMKVFYHCNLLGQYFMHLGFSGEREMLGNGIQILISGVIFAIAYLAGTMELNHRDVK